MFKELSFLIMLVCCIVLWREGGADDVGGIGGLRGRNSIQSTENIKSQGKLTRPLVRDEADSIGKLRIDHVGAHMGLGHSVKQGAQRLFALAVDSNFHRGRRKDYVVASCLYLQSRLRKEPHMLIDFSERLQVS
jgi:transcription factor IIIB subunit 2